MKKFIQGLLLVFGAGCAGGAANSMVVWLFGRWGVTAWLGVSIAPALTPAWLYPRIVWGGIWSGLFLFPLLRRKTISRAFLFSLGPTIVQLFVVFPIQAQKGLMGMDLGLLTPLFVVFFNFVWGLTTAWLLKIAGR
jgi:hypothetical protein